MSDPFRSLILLNLIYYLQNVFSRKNTLIFGLIRNVNFKFQILVQIGLKTRMTTSIQAKLKKSDEQAATKQLKICLNSIPFFKIKQCVRE